MNRKVLTQVVYLTSTLLFFAPGCAPTNQRVQLHGELMLKGEPLPNVLVAFIPISGSNGLAIRSMGVTDSNGHFVLQTESLLPGIDTGTFKVILEDMDLQRAPTSSDGTVLKMPPKRFHDKYSNLIETPLVAEVDRETTYVKVDLTTSKIIDQRAESDLTVESSNREDF